MNPLSFSRTGSLCLCLGIMISLMGCVSLGEGITAREFEAGLQKLASGMTQAEVLASLGEPREKRTVSSDATHTSTWVYSQLETIGRETVLNEGAVGRGGAGIPTYEERDKKAVVEYHLDWNGDTLLRSRRVVRD